MNMPRLLSFISVLALAATAALAQDHARSAAPGSMEAAAAASGKVIRALQNAGAIRAYQWTETMVIMVDGKEKETVVNACSYNDNGGVARTAANTPAAKTVAGGAPGTSTEIAGYVNEAVGLMRPYVRPDATRLQKCQDASRVSLSMEDAGKREKLEYRDYSKKGDTLVLMVDPSTSQILSLVASTYMTNAADRASIHTEMSQLPDGTGYPSRVTFETPGRQMGAVVTNSDYKKKTS
jgi:hypothetical protein